MTKKSETLDFARRYLRAKPDASFAEIRDAAAAEDLKIYPIVYGRAKALEGLVKVAPYGSKKRAREKARQEADAARSGQQERAAPPDRSEHPGLSEHLEQAVAGEDRRMAVAPPRGAAPGSLTSESIEAVIAGMREHHEVRERYRVALIKIGEILDEVL